MKDNNTYQPEDIEALLVAKTFDELLEEEKQFVLQHLDSKKEYVQMRNTLLAIKQATKNDNQIKPDEIVKDKLLAMFEEQKNKAAWWRLNSIGAFLFPYDVNLVRKPGFQLASFAALLAIMLTIGNSVFSPNMQSELAINQSKSKKLEKTKANNNSIKKRVIDVIIEKENTNEEKFKKRSNEMFDQTEESSKILSSEVIKSQRISDFIELDDLALEVDEEEIEEEISEIPVRVYKPSIPAIPIIKDGIVITEKKGKAKATSPIDLKEYKNVGDKVKDDQQTIANSQSLEDSENLIDLLEVIL